MEKIIILASYSLMGIALFFQGAVLIMKKKSMTGKSPIGKGWFVLSKLAIFISFGFSILKATGRQPFFALEVPVFLMWTGIILIAAGSIFATIAFFNLGLELKFGIPSEKTSLKTKGLYSISRNPIYFAFFVICAGSVIYYPDLFNIFFAMLGIYLHYQITLAEEKFLETAFGKDWNNYKKKVRRFI